MDFTAFRERVLSSFRLDLTAYKENQLKRRMDSLMVKQKLNMGDYEGFLKLLVTDRRAFTDFLDTLTINVSEFFRDKSMFGFLEEKVLPELLAKRKALKIWSAACSNGSEPYSVAIILKDISLGCHHRIEATDIDRNILQAAAEASYTQDQIRNVSAQRKSKYLRQEESTFILNDSIKKAVSFRQHDLLMDPFGQGYDLIFCRNVAIYFTREAQDKLNIKFCRALNPGGVYFIGASEMIFNYNDLGFEKLASCFYRKKQ